MPDNPPSTRTGRPSDYTQEKASAICDMIAQGMSLRTIEQIDDMPSMTTVFNWLAKHSDFLERYARAREQQMEAMAEEILAIADETGVDPQMARLRVDTRKWLMSKLAVKKYGDRVNQVHTGADGGAVKVEQISPLEEIEDRLKRLSERSEQQPAPKATLN